MNKYLSIITLDVSGLNAPIKRHKVAEWIRKYDPHKCCLQDTHLRTKHLHGLKMKGQKKNSPSKQTETKKQKNRVTILISDKIDFKTKAITRDKEGHYIILKRVVQQGDNNLVNI